MRDLRTNPEMAEWMQTLLYKTDNTKPVAFPLTGITS